MRLRHKIGMAILVLVFGGLVLAIFGALLYDALVNGSVLAAATLAVIVLTVLGLWLIHDC